jgi:hypothetical protein
MPPEETHFDPQQEMEQLIHQSEDEVGDLEAAVRERFATPETEVAPTPEDSGASTVVEQPGESEPATSPPPSDTWEVDGRTLTKDQAETFLRFEQFLEENPNVADAIQRAVQETQTPAQQPAVAESPAPSTPPEPPEELDLSDPVVKTLWDTHQATLQQIAQLQELITRHDVQLTTQTEATSAALVERAVSSYKKERNLNDDQMNKVRQIAASMNIVDSLVQTVDPITGILSKPNPLAAVEKALDIAYWSIPEFREQEITRQFNERVAEDEKKRKLSSLGGSSGSTPREQPTPVTKEDIKKAMTREVAEHMGVPPSN